MSKRHQVEANNPVFTALDKLGNVNGINVVASMGEEVLGTRQINVKMIDAMGQPLLSMQVWANAEPQYAVKLVRHVASFIQGER